MLGVLCSRPKPWILTSLNLHHHHHHHHRHGPIHFSGLPDNRLRRRHHSIRCQFTDSSSSSSSSSSCVGGAASIWHAILPSSGEPRMKTRRLPERKGEGSWNVAWDARPARWLHRPDSAWLLFGVCACLAPVELIDANSAHEAIPDVDDEKIDGVDLVVEERDPDYKVTGVLADGRCLFRAIVHGACLRRGEEAPDDNHQMRLADELRAQVVDELLKRREETEWFIEGDFDAYVKQIQQPYVWGGEPELLMASHVLKIPVSVFMRGSSGSLVNIANYGQEYGKDDESPISLLFHGYGHYELLETLPEEES